MKASRWVNLFYCITFTRIIKLGDRATINPSNFPGSYNLASRTFSDLLLQILSNTGNVKGKQVMTGQ